MTPTLTAATLEEPVMIAPVACEGCCDVRADYTLMKKRAKVVIIVLDDDK